MIEIKVAQKSDFAVVFPLIKSLWHYRCFNETETRAVFDGIVSDKNAFAFIALKDGNGAGFCHGTFFKTLWMCGETCYLSGLIVHEAYRRQGIGTFLLEKAKAESQRRGAKAIILESAISRKIAHAFYEAQGFEKSCFGFEFPL